MHYVPKIEMRAQDLFWQSQMLWYLIQLFLNLISLLFCYYIYPLLLATFIFNLYSKKEICLRFWIKEDYFIVVLSYMVSFFKILQFLVLNTDLVPLHPILLFKICLCFPMGSLIFLFGINCLICPLYLQ